MSDQQSSGCETQGDARYPVEFLVVERNKETSEVVFRSPDDDEAVVQHISRQRNGMDSQLAITIPPEFCTRVDGFAVGLTRGLPISFHLYSQAAEAAAFRHAEATGEIVSVDPAVAIIVPQTVVSQLRTTADKLIDAERLLDAQSPGTAVTTA